MHICEYCEWGKVVTNMTTGNRKAGCSLTYLAFPQVDVPHCQSFTLSKECVETGNHPETPEEELTDEDRRQAATWVW